MATYALRVAALLIVEDDSSLRTTWVRSLPALGLGNVIARCAGRRAEALALLAVHDDWAGYLIDVHLGSCEAEGLDVLERVRRADIDAPCFLLTGDATPELSHAAARLDAVFLRKPLPDLVVLRALLVRVAARAEEVDRRARAKRWLGETPLTLRERDVVLAVSLGEPEDDYCARTSITRNTLRTHLKSATHKLGLESVLALRELARRKSS